MIMQKFWMSVVPSCMVVFLLMVRRSAWKFLKDLSVGTQTSMCYCFFELPIYGLKQTAYAFWHELLKAFNSVKYIRTQGRSMSVPCLDSNRSH